MIAYTLRGAALALAGATLLSALPLSPAEAQYYPYPRRNYTGEAVAGGVLGGVLGGLAAGAILNPGRPAPIYAPPAPVYVQPAPVYLRPEPVYEEVQTCHLVRRKVWLDPYTYTYRRDRVCD
jgi:hypothetical protein